MACSCSDMQLRLGARARNSSCILSHTACITLRADILVARSIRREGLHSAMRSCLETLGR
jgi:hypothetical protein